MAEIKWIKITTDMFDNRKIKHLRKLPEGNSIVLIWVMLLTMAGRCNSGGMIFLTENIAYTTKMLADELDFEESTIQLALKALSDFGMIVLDGNLFKIAGWDEYQNIDGMEKIREQTRVRVANYRERKKLYNVTDNVMETQCNAIEEDKERDIDIDKEKDKERNKRTEFSEIVDLYHMLCPSYPKIKTLSESRKKAIRARLNTYTIEDFKAMFRKAEASDFLKGSNSRDWSASFDWMIKDSNMAKILDGNYDNKTKSTNSQNGQPYFKDDLMEILTGQKGG